MSRYPSRTLWHSLKYSKSNGDCRVPAVRNSDARSALMCHLPGDISASRFQTFRITHHSDTPHSPLTASRNSFTPSDYASEAFD
jgi:hypothetical protein